MALMAAQYSVEKMRKVMNELRGSFTAHAQNNQTSSFRENNNPDKHIDKRNSNNLIDSEGIDLN